MKISSQPSPRGAAIVELAVCLPIVILVIIAALDVHRVLRVKQDIVEVTHELARVIATNELTEAEAQDFALVLLDNKQLVDATVLIEPPPSSDTPRSVPISVSISIPLNQNLTTMTQLFMNGSLVSNSTVVREIGDFPADTSLSDDDD